MPGLENSTCPHVRTLIDDKKGELLGFWKQLAPVNDADGKPYEIRGTGGSRFRYARDFKWAWQRDAFDHINTVPVFGAMMQAGQLTGRMQERMKAGSKMQRWTRIDEFDWFETLEDPEA